MGKNKEQNLQIINFGIRAAKAILRRGKRLWMRCTESVDKNIICPVIYYFIEKKQKRIEIDRSKPILFFCHTPYHVLITLSKAMLSEKQIAIMLYSKMPNVQEVYDHLKKSDIFSKVYLSDFKDDEMEQKYYKYAQKKYFVRWKRKQEIIEREHNLEIIKQYYVQMYNDFCLLGYYLNVIRQPYDVLEDGLNVYEKDGFIDRRCLKTYKDIAYNYIRRTVIMGYAGSAMARRLEVNDKSIIYMPYSVQILEQPRKELIQRLSEENKKSILEIFGLNTVVEQLQECKGKKNLILTQPLVEDYVVDSAEQQIWLYKEIIKNLEGNVFIKLHPRDKVDYSKIVNEHCHLFVRSDFPIEIINFTTIEFEECVTLCSSSVSGLYNIKHSKSLFTEYGEIRDHIKKFYQKV